MSLEVYDSTLLGILQNEGQIDKFLDVVIGFLYRRYLFLHVYDVICVTVNLFFLSDLSNPWHNIKDKFTRSGVEAEKLGTYDLHVKQLKKKAVLKKTPFMHDHDTTNKF